MPLSDYFFTNSAGDTAATRMVRNLPATVQQIASGGAAPAAEAVAAPVAAAVPEAPGFLSKLAPGSGRAFLPSLGDAFAGARTAVGAAAKYAGPLVAPAMMLKDVYNGVTDPASAAVQPAFQESQKHTLDAATNLAQGNYLKAAGNYALGAASTGANLALQQIPGYTSLYNSLGTTSAPKIDATDNEAIREQLRKDAQPEDKRDAVDISSLPKLTIGHLKALAPFLTKPVAPVDPIKGQYMNIIAKQHDDAVKAAGTDGKALKQAHADYAKAYSLMLSQGVGPAAYYSPPFQQEP